MCSTIESSPQCEAFGALDQIDLSDCDAQTARSALTDVRVLRGWLDRLEAALTTRLAQAHGAAAELHVRAQGVSQAEARRRERRAAVLEQATGFADALGAGAVAAEHADVLAQALGRLDEPERASLLAHEQTLLAHAETSTPESFARHCRALAASLGDRQGVEQDSRQRRDTRLAQRVEAASGMHVLSGRFHPELGARIFAAIDAQAAALHSDGACSDADRERLAAEALGLLVTSGQSGASAAPRGDVLVTIDLETLLQGLRDASVCETTTGAALAPESVRRLCCDHGIVPAVLDGAGRVLDLGRSQRLASRAQRTALQAMHATCAFPDCSVRVARCRIHHVADWRRGGETDLANLVPLCDRHHWLVHEGGWTIHLDDARTVTAYLPDGTCLGTSCLRGSTPPEVATDPATIGVGHEPRSGIEDSRHLAA